MDRVSILDQFHHAASRKLINSALGTGFSPFGNFDFTVDVPSMAQSMYNSDDDGYASEQIVRKLALVLFGVHSLIYLKLKCLTYF
ncbi:MAG: hypothetical protein Ct9H300mP9_3970 [Candidatus Neomarinimicrobiota bacterium]|nr:MAG: hypothetical protein Ct9H300mP9_3970 [Candidatus Neomarinimicrobiota bacterium]